MKKFNIAIIIFAFAMMQTTTFAQKELYVSTHHGNDLNAGTKENPLKTIGAAIAKMDCDGGVVFWNFDEFSVVYDGLKISKRAFQDESPLVIDGCGNTLVFGFAGEYNPARNAWRADSNSPWKKFHPSNAPRTWNGISIMDCSNVVLRRIRAWGAQSATCKIDDSYPEIGVKNIRVEDCEFRYGQPRTIFVGGSNIDGLTFLRVYVTATMFGDVTHSVYISGGHWNSAYPPVRNVSFIGCLIEQAGGRHDLQFNGRFVNVLIRDCVLRFGMLANISLIGVRRARIENNELFGGNKQNIVLYDYWWKNFDPTNPDDVAEFLATHQPNRNILIRNNTIHQSKRWTKDKYHVFDPVDFAPIEINNAVHDMPVTKNGVTRKFYELYGNVYAPDKFIICDNVIESINKDSMAIRFYHPAEAAATTVIHNMIHCVGVPRIGLPGELCGIVDDTTIPALEETYPGWYAGNILKYYAPQAPPKYEFIDKDTAPDFLWGDSYKVSFNGFSFIARKNGVGKKYKVPVLSDGKTKKNNPGH